MSYEITPAISCHAPRVAGSHVGQDYVVRAAAITVNSTVDAVDATPGNGVCDDGSGNCTLRAAIMEANALAGADTITLPAGTYTLSPLPGQTRMQGPPANSTLLTT